MIMEGCCSVSVSPVAPSVTSLEAEAVVIVAGGLVVLGLMGAHRLTESRNSPYTKDECAGAITLVMKSSLLACSS